MNVYYALAVVSAWSCSPVFRRAAIDKMGEGSEATFVVYNTILCTLIGVTVAFPSRERMYKDAAGGGALALFFVLCCSCLAMSSGYFLSKLLSENNPGEIMPTLNGLANVVGYLIGTVFYGSFTATGAVGVLLVSGGIYLIRAGSS